MRSYTYTTQAAVRAEFWVNLASEPVRGWTQNDYPANIRRAFVDFVDSLEKNGDISEALAYRVTL
jgi:hypothetical protein